LCWQDEEDAVASAMLEHFDCILALVNENDSALRLTEFGAITTHLVESLSRNVLGHDWRRQVRLCQCVRLAHVLTDYSDAIVADIIAVCQQSIEVVRLLCDPPASNAPADPDLSWVRRPYGVL
jgi:hypothetical protein